MSGTARAIFALACVSSVAAACGGSAAQAANAPSPTAARDASPAAKPGAWPFGPALSADKRAAQLARLARDHGPIKSNWTPPGHHERYGHAEGLLSASVSDVRARVADFAHYKALAGPKFRSVRMIDKKPGTTDLYFQLPIMHGLVTLWYVTRFTPPRAVPGRGDVVEGKFVRGNIRDMHLVFTVRPGADDKSAVLVCDLNLALKIPAPQSAIDEELRDACGDAINQVRATLAKK